MSRGPYKRDERVLKDEQLLKTLREYTGREENFEFPRLEEQQKLFAKFKQGMLLSLSLSTLSLFLLCGRPYLSPSVEELFSLELLCNPYNRQWRYLHNQKS